MSSDPFSSVEVGLTKSLYSFWKNDYHPTWVVHKLLAEGECRCCTSETTR